MLSEKQKEELLALAKSTLSSHILGKPLAPFSNSDPVFHQKPGAFVTLHNQGELRGCIGMMESGFPLFQTIIQMTKAASTEDPRFVSVSENELEEIDIEISVLTPRHKISSIEEIEVGKHGLWIEKGVHKGVLLPQVATEQNWDREKFLSHTCVKAGLHPDEWKKENTTIMIFEALVFGEK